MQESALKQSASKRSPNQLVMHPEHGLLVPVHARLKGRTTIRAYDRNMRPVLLRTPSGLPIGPIEGVQNDNLITDLGLDGIGLYDPLATNPNASNYRSFLGVGTGTADPNIADVALDNEVQRASSAGSFSSPNNIGELDTDNNVWRAISAVVRVVQMSTDRNLTEFGLGRQTGDLLHIRELIRDVNGDPITVSLLEDMFFRCDHSLVVEIDAPENGFTGTINIEEYDAGDQLENTIPVNITWGLRAGNNISVVASNAAGGTGVSDAGTIMATWNPSQNSYAHRGSSPAGSYNRVSNIAGFTPSPGGFISALGAYIPGSFERLKRMTFSAGDQNGDWYGFAIRSGGTSASPGNANGAGVATYFDSPASYEKLNTTTLRVGMISTWGRAD